MERKVLSDAGEEVLSAEDWVVFVSIHIYMLLLRRMDTWTQTECGGAKKVNGGGSTHSAFDASLGTVARLFLAAFR